MRREATQTAWARVIVEALIDAGVRDVVISPGSRSTPLAAALHGVTVHPIIDERAAGFFALGLARAANRPVALVCTSGTAAAHYYPAVIEAALSGVPLVVVTADRPPELHDGGAPQTIDQTRLYGVHVRAAIDLGPPDGAALSLRALRRRVAQAVLAARAPRPGPVHLNVPLRKPLEPVALLPDEERSLPRGPLPEPPRAPRAEDVTGLADALASARRPMIIVGPRGLHEAIADAVARLARQHGAAVLAEATSQLAPLGSLHAFDVVLASRRAPSPDLIVQLGAEPVAMAWSAWLAAHRDVPRWIVSAEPWPDPDASASLIIGDVADALDRVSTTPRRVPVDPAWRAALERTDADVRAAIAALLHPRSEHAALAAALAGAGDATIALGNSLPVRTIDHVWRGANRVLSQRGASGIDGLVAGAAGAAATGEPVVLVLGDVSFAHDAGAVALLRATRAPVIVVVIDNRGGRIFEALPAADLPDLERLWLTPPDLDVAAVARAFGVPARTVRSPDELRAAVAAARRIGSAVIHAPVAPSSARELRAAAIARLDQTPALALPLPAAAVHAGATP